MTSLRWFRPALLLVAGLALAGLLPAAEDWRPLFNGRDLSGWETWLGRPHLSIDLPNLARGTDGKYTQPVGLNQDPFAIFTVVPVDGAPAIRLSGQIFGTISSLESFSNYHLRLQFKWGEKRWPPRAAAVRDSGLLYHGHGPHGGGTGSPWINSHELQIQEKDCGDYWAVGPVTSDITAKPAGEKLFQYDQISLPLPFGPGNPSGTRVIKSADFEKPHGEWNTIELICLGDQSIHIVNGRVVLRVRSLRSNAGEKLTAGKIQIQTEGAEIFYRNIEIRPITAVPPLYRE